MPVTEKNTQLLAQKTANSPVGEAINDTAKDATKRGNKGENPVLTKPLIELTNKDIVSLSLNSTNSNAADTNKVTLPIKPVPFTNNHTPVIDYDKYRVPEKLSAEEIKERDKFADKIIEVYSKVIPGLRAGQQFQPAGKYGTFPPGVDPRLATRVNNIGEEFDLVSNTISSLDDKAPRFNLILNHPELQEEELRAWIKNIGAYLNTKNIFFAADILIAQDQRGELIPMVPVMMAKLSRKENRVDVFPDAFLPIDPNTKMDIPLFWTEGLSIMNGVAATPEELANEKRCGGTISLPVNRKRRSVFIFEQNIDKDENEFDKFLDNTVKNRPELKAYYLGTNSSLNITVANEATHFAHFEFIPNFDPDTIVDPNRKITFTQFTEAMSDLGSLVSCRNHKDVALVLSTNFRYTEDNPRYGYSSKIFNQAIVNMLSGKQETSAEYIFPASLKTKKQIQRDELFSLIIQNPDIIPAIREELIYNYKKNLYPIQEDIMRKMQGQ